MEMFDIYDEAMNPIGTASRQETHRQGYWHRTFQCWIVRVEDGIPYVLLQLRHPDKDTFPNMLDKSSAGHLAAGESIEDGVRELEEELGLAVPFEALTSCGVIPIESVEEHWKDREFCHLFVYRCDLPLREYRPQIEEVSGLYQATISGFFDLVEGRTGRIELTGMRWNEDEERWIDSSLQAGLGDLTPQNADYYAIMKKGLQELGFGCS